MNFTWDAENLRDLLFDDGKWYADYLRIRMKAYKA